MRKRTKNTPAAPCDVLFRAVKIEAGGELPDEGESVLLGFADNEWEPGYREGRLWRLIDGAALPPADVPVCWASFPDVPFCDPISTPEPKTPTKPKTTR